MRVDDRTFSIFIPLRSLCMHVMTPGDERMTEENARNSLFTSESPKQEIQRAVVSHYFLSCKCLKWSLSVHGNSLSSMTRVYGRSSKYTKLNAVYPVVMMPSELSLVIQIEPARRKRGYNNDAWVVSK